MPFYYLYHMTNPEKIQQLERLYPIIDELSDKIHDGTITDEDTINQAVAYVDELLALFPIDFPPGSQIIQSATLEHWKFVILIKGMINGRNPRFHKPMLEQAHKCLAALPLKMPYEVTLWEREVIIAYTHAIGHNAILLETDPAQLESSRTILERGFELANETQYNYIKHTMVRLLLKLERQDDAFIIVKEMLSKYPDDTDFQQYKDKTEYTTWLTAHEQLLLTTQATLLASIESEKAAVTDQFIHPHHPLVQQYAPILNMIKQRMAEIRIRQFIKKLQEGSLITDKITRKFDFRTWSLSEIETFETTTGLTLPNEYKVCLMEIGSDRSAFFLMGKIPGLDELAGQIQRVNKPSPVTRQPIWPMAEEQFPDDGCLFMGMSWELSHLYLVMGGPFAGEVWSDYYERDEKKLYWESASIHRTHFLGFVAESLLVKLVGYENAPLEGDWM